MINNPITRAMEAYDEHTRGPSEIKAGIPAIVGAITLISTAVTLTKVENMPPLLSILAGAGVGLISGLVVATAIYHCCAKSARSTGETVSLPSASIRVNYGDE